MSLFSQLLALSAVGAFFACVLFVIFGQVTVRKLRKNPETRAHLGVELASGWDIINVAQSLAIPRSWSRKLEASPISVMYANSEELFKHTNRLDRFLGFIFYWLLTISGFSMIGLVILNSLGVFDS